MRRSALKLTLVTGAVVVLGSLVSVLAGICVNLSTEVEPEFNLPYILPAVLFSVLASAVLAAGEHLRSQLASRRATATDPSTATDLLTYQRLLKDRRAKARTPRFAELERRADELGIAYERSDLDKVTKVTRRAPHWLKDAEGAEPVIRAFLAVHDVPEEEAETWVRAHQKLTAPQTSVLTRHMRLGIVAAVAVLGATGAFVVYVIQAEAQVRDRLRRTNVTILSLYAPGRYLAVNSTSGSPHARLGASVTNTYPFPHHGWDFEPGTNDGAYFYQIRNRATERCLTPEANSIREGVYITDATCDGSDDQLWRLTNDHALAIASPQGDLCAEPNLGSMDAGTPLVLRACAKGRPGQRWTVTDRLPNLGGALASSQNGVCLDAWGALNVTTWECHGRANQAFSYARNPRSGDYEIKVMGTCLGVAGPARHRYPARVPCSDKAPGPLWRITYRSPKREWLYWEVKHVPSGLCLELEPDGRSLSMRPCVRSVVQQWRTPGWLQPPNTPVHPAHL